jgi:pyruvate kinase
VIRTKIVATLGPATDEPGVLDRMIRAGLDVVRLNFSHGTPERHRERVRLVRERADALGVAVGVMIDLAGPKIRIARFAGGAPVHLAPGAHFTLDPDWPADAGTPERVGVTYPGLFADVAAGDRLLLDDGRIVLAVASVAGRAVRCTVVTGGALSGAKGLNRAGGGLSAPALTEKDRADIATAAALEADYLAVSFPRSAADLEEARALLRAAGGRGGIVAKLERADALADLPSFVLAADAVMIARGDLGVEIGDAALPPVQKHAIRLCRKLNRAVIVATQMMESMIESELPTRAEVFDVANAVLDGTDAVMFSAETAVGRHPVAVVEAADRVCREAEKQRAARISHHRIDSRFTRVDEAVAMAAMYTANHLDVRAVAALTESGSTALWMSRIASGLPIYALSPHQETLRRVTLYRGVHPVRFAPCVGSPHHEDEAAVAELRRLGAVHAGDLVIITRGDLLGVPGGTNALRIVRVPGAPPAAAAGAAHGSPPAPAPRA